MPKPPTRIKAVWREARSASGQRHAGVAGWVKNGATHTLHLANTVNERAEPKKWRMNERKV